MVQRSVLSCFQEKWIPVFRPETRQNNNLGSGFDSIKTGRTLGTALEIKHIFKTLAQTVYLFLTKLVPAIPDWPFVNQTESIAAHIGTLERFRTQQNRENALSSCLVAFS